MRIRLATPILAAALAAGLPALALSPEVEELMKVRDRLAAAQCEQARIQNEAADALARNDAAQYRKLREEGRRLDADPELAALAKRNVELSQGKFYAGEEARALREQSQRHKECFKKK